MDCKFSIQTRDTATLLFEEDSDVEVSGVRPYAAFGLKLFAFGGYED